MADRAVQAPIPADFARRGTLTEQLNRLPNVTEEERAQIIEEIEQQSRDYKGFRHDSAATQNRKNHHLEQYTKWLLFLERRELEDFADEDELDEWRFPTNPDEHERMFEHFRQFLLFVFKAAEPRSRTSGQYIKYQTLVQYRESLVFWVRHKARMRDAPFPSSKMRYVMTEVRLHFHIFTPVMGGLSFDCTAHHDIFAAQSLKKLRNDPTRGMSHSLTFSATGNACCRNGISERTSGRR